MGKRVFGVGKFSHLMSAGELCGSSGLSVLTQDSAETVQSNSAAEYRGPNVRTGIQRFNERYPDWNQIRETKYTRVSRSL